MSLRCGYAMTKIDKELLSLAQAGTNGVHPLDAIRELNHLTAAERAFLNKRREYNLTHPSEVEPAYRAIITRLLCQISALEFREAVTATNLKTNKESEVA